MLPGNSSSLLELEAADYFRLDPAQVNMLCSSSSATRGESSSFSGARAKSKTNQTAAISKSAIKSRASIRIAPEMGRQRPRSESEQTTEDRGRLPARGNNNQQQTGIMKIRKETSPSLKKRAQQQEQQIYSSTASTNSLPSISSSPSISPSLVCPHLTLDDLLNGRYISRSPHTIGLCDSCKLDPPANIHSPLSPAFKPSATMQSKASNNSFQVPKMLLEDRQQPMPISGYSERRKLAGGLSTLRRGYSDVEEANRRIRPSPIKDDSLDFYLDPHELRRSLMSPIQRNSVEFIRKYSTEVGRVVKVFKNGQAFEKPLRICITRGDFANLNQLLDHINSRQLVPCGARYLFHLDGQLVYSVNELKHGSSYIVSGSRNFDTKASTMIKEQQFRELSQTHSLHERSMQRKMLDRRSSRSLSSLNQLIRPGDTADTVVVSYSNPTTESGPRTAKESHKRPSNHMRPSMKQSKPLADIGQTNREQNMEPKLLRSNRKGLSSSNRRTIVADDRYPSGGEQKSRSSENLDGIAAVNSEPSTEVSKQMVGNLSRAKSELSSSALKRKKMVTFVDTERTSSPIMRRTEIGVDDRLSGSKRAQSKTGGEEISSDKSTENNPSKRNDIGIQVSDSIDGFLIDLPLPLPKKGEEKREQQASQSKLRVKKRIKVAGQRPNRAEKIVTITERDLSLDEMDQLKDLDHGDHHNETHKIKQVVIKLDSADTSASTSTNEAPQAEDLAGSTSAPEVDRRAEKRVSQEDGSGGGEVDRRLEVESSNQMDPTSVGNPIETDQLGASNDKWQYPGGRRSSATPEERPVSQNEPNGSIHARVTTPTPSLSTTGDNNSLSMSYEGVQANDGQVLQPNTVVKSASRRVLPPKEYIAVEGKLFGDLEAPSKNLKLTWVNGFTINDLYPDNSTTVAGTAPATATGLVVEPTTSQRGSHRDALLSPSGFRPTSASGQQLRSAVQFRPSERFRNWICHSRLHDELIYPAGCLVVLWCRWTNEQRYYSRHLSNVTALTLASSQPDVIASSEVGGSDLEHSHAGAIVHLWSSTSLQTLMTIDEPAHFRGFKVFSLNLRKLAANQEWNLLVGSRDGRQPSQSLQLLDIKLQLSGNEEPPHGAQVTPNKLTISKATRALQVNQSPLLVTHVPIESDKLSSEKRSAKPSAADQTRHLLLSFGRRHFQLWSPDWPRQKLQLWQVDEKSGAFVELIARSNCLARLAPNEFLVGDSSGSITLVIIKVPQQSTPSKAPLSGSTGSPASAKFRIEMLRLVDSQPREPTEMPSQRPEQMSKSAATGGANQSISVTCLTRISGSVFASGHSNSVVRFWKIERNRKEPTTSSNLTCRQLTCISLPPDLGFVCSIVSSSFEWKKSIAEFYLISTSNAILFGSIQLSSSALDSKSDPKITDVLAHSSLSVVYEGHETSVMSLVADSAVDNKRSKSRSQLDGSYFTCSLDFKICKWKGKSLVWKSTLPSACVSMAVHPTGLVLAIGSVDGTVYVLDKTSGLLISYFPLTPVCINCLSYSCDGSLLAAGCSNGSIFILPVQENGLKYRKVSIFQSPYLVVSLQFSLDNRYLLTSVTNSQYQDLILWDLPNFRYMRDNVKMVADRISWFEPVCSGSEDVRAIWENVNLTAKILGHQTGEAKANRLIRKRPSTMGAPGNQQAAADQQLVVNLSCHRLIEQPDSLCVASDTRGYLRLFKYPCRDIEQAFYQTRATSSRLNCCRFLAPKTDLLVSSALDGSVFLWTLR